MDSFSISTAAEQQLSNQYGSHYRSRLGCQKPLYVTGILAPKPQIRSGKSPWFRLWGDRKLDGWSLIERANFPRIGFLKNAWRTSRVVGDYFRIRG